MAQAIDQPLQVEVAPDYEAMSRRAADSIIDTLHAMNSEVGDRPLNAVFSAGRTPTRAYELLASDPQYRFDWSRLRLFQMDEFVDVNDASERFNPYLRRHVVEPLNLRDVHLLQPHRPDDRGAWTESIRRQETYLRDHGGIDFIVHGIGTNGHLGFNEPGTETNSEAGIVHLARTTRDSFAGPMPPTLGVTLGMSILLSARASLLLASGGAKAAAIRSALIGPLIADCPASALRRCRAVSVIVDEAAAGALTVTVK